MQLIVTGSMAPALQALLGTLFGSLEIKSTILIMACTVIGVLVVKSLLGIGFRWWMLKKSTKLESEASIELFRLFMSTTYLSHKARNLGEINRDISAAVPQAFGQVAMGFIAGLADALTIIGIFIVLLAVSPLATTFTVIFFGAALLSIQSVFRRKYRAVGLELAESDVNSWAAMIPALSSFRETRVSMKEEHFIGRFAEAKNSRASAARRLSMFAEMPKYVLEVGFVVGLGLLALLLFSFEPSNAATATLGVFAAASTRILPTLNRLQATSAMIRSGQVGLELIGKCVRDLDSTQEVYASSGRIPQGRHDLEFSGVSYRYPDSEFPVVQNLDLDFPDGKTTALVGGSGAGKSTILDLLLGVIRPDTGTIEYGGTSIDVDPRGWFSRVSLVPQDIYLVNDSVERNIAFGVDDDEIDRELLSEVIRDAQLEDVIDSLPQGLSTRIGEWGARLSGGQKQRVGIARALYRRPQILILDEATSALDNLTERKISDTVTALAGRMTVVIVAHRLSTVRNAETIYFLEAGRVAARGGFEDLVQRSPEFARLARLGGLA
ncbi:ABC transporter ATP-binding protein [Arthrobacter horti]|nr:ABC transporter ATP-binding protein [Arthrobacter sp. YJM1]